MEDTATETALCEVAKEALDHVEPRTAGRREVDMETRMTRQPAAHLGMLVRRGVIDDEVQVLVGGRDIVDNSQKLQPFLVAVSVVAHADHRAIQGVQRGKQRRRAVTLVVVRHRAAASGRVPGSGPSRPRTTRGRARVGTWTEGRSMRQDTSLRTCASRRSVFK